MVVASLTKIVSGARISFTICGEAGVDVTSSTLMIPGVSFEYACGNYMIIACILSNVMKETSYYSIVPMMEALLSL